MYKTIVVVVQKCKMIECLTTLFIKKLLKISFKKTFKKSFKKTFKISIKEDIPEISIP